LEKQRPSTRTASENLSKATSDWVVGKEKGGTFQKTVIGRQVQTRGRKKITRPQAGKKTGSSGGMDHLGPLSLRSEEKVRVGLGSGKEIGKPKKN